MVTLSCTSASGRRNSFPTPNYNSFCIYLFLIYIYLPFNSKFGLPRPASCRDSPAGLAAASPAGAALSAFLSAELFCKILPNPLLSRNKELLHKYLLKNTFLTQFKLRKSALEILFCGGDAQGRRQSCAGAEVSIHLSNPVQPAGFLRHFAEIEKNKIQNNLLFLFFVSINDLLRTFGPNAPQEGAVCAAAHTHTAAQLHKSLQEITLHQVTFTFLFI